MNEVQKAFDELAAMTLDATHSELQWKEMRRAFFAGVAWAISESERHNHSPAWGDAVIAECAAFGKQIEAGNA
jgi:hypothetical protein